MQESTITYVTRDGYEYESKCDREIKLYSRDYKQERGKIRGDKICELSHMLTGMFDDFYDEETGRINCGKIPLDGVSKKTLMFILEYIEYKEKMDKSDIKTENKLEDTTKLNMKMIEKLYKFNIDEQDELEFINFFKVHSYIDPETGKKNDAQIVLDNYTSADNETKETYIRVHNIYRLYCEVDYLDISGHGIMPFLIVNYLGYLQHVEQLFVYADLDIRTDKSKLCEQMFNYKDMCDKTDIQGFDTIENIPNKPVKLSIMFLEYIRWLSEREQEFAKSVDPLIGTAVKKEKVLTREAKEATYATDKDGNVIMATDAQPAIYEEIVTEIYQRKGFYPYNIYTRQIEKMVAKDHNMFSLKAFMTGEDGKSITGESGIKKLFTMSRELYNLIRKKAYEQYTKYTHVDLSNDIRKYMAVEWMKKDGKDFGITGLIEKYLLAAVDCANIPAQTEENKAELANNPLVKTLQEITEAIEKACLDDMTYLFDIVYTRYEVYCNQGDEVEKKYNTSLEIAGFTLAKLIEGLIPDKLKQVFAGYNNRSSTLTDEQKKKVLDELAAFHEAKKAEEEAAKKALEAAPTAMDTSD